MKRTPEATETELAILDVLWNNGPCHVRQIVQTLYEKHTPALHATVKSLLDRLIEKQLVSIDRSQFAHQYSAEVSREQYVGNQIQQLADNHFNGALAPMFTTMLGRTTLSQKQRKALLEIINSIDEG